MYIMVKLNRKEKNMPRQNREKIGEMPCKVCASVIDVKEQKNGVAYGYCNSCGIKHIGGLNSAEKLGGLEHYGAKCINLEQTNINIDDSVINGTANGTANIQINNNKKEKDTKNDDWLDGW